jgi:two-component system, cell cycle response regulator DivK
MANERILIVEDNEKNRKLVRDTLQFKGYETVEAETGEDGVRLAKEHIPALVLMDIQLPGIDGYEATRRIKADETLERIPLIVVTSYALSGDDAKALAAGADAYVAKPFSPRAMLSKVREYLRD